MPIYINLLYFTCIDVSNEALFLQYKLENDNARGEKTADNWLFNGKYDYFLTRQRYFGVELSFETMVEAGIIEESAYYESLHETPLIANTIARKKLYEMNATISDTAEYGCYLFDHACKPLLSDFMKNIETDVIGKPFGDGKDNGVDNQKLIAINEEIRFHPVEIIGTELRESMTAMINIL